MAQQVVDSSRPLMSGAAISGLGRPSPGAKEVGPRGGEPAARGFYGRERGRCRRIVSCGPLNHCLAAAFSTSRRTTDDTQGDQQPAKPTLAGQRPLFVRATVAHVADGLIDSDFTGKPVIAIVNTWSEMNTCHGHLRDVAQVVKRGVWEAGGYPVELPACRSARS